MDLYDYNTIKRILTRHGFTFSKALGQNFLIDPSVCPRMAAALEADERTGVLEIGPGIGVLTKELSAVCGRVAAVELDRRLRAFNPFPGGATQLGEEVIKLWTATPEAYAGTAQPGTVLAADADGVLVACGEGALRLTLLQRAGGKRLPAADFLRGFALPVGSVLSTAENA